MNTYFTYVHQVVRTGAGELVVARRPTSVVKAWSYVPCTICYAFCHKDTLHLHINRCPLRKSDNKSTPKDSFSEGMLLIEPHLPAMAEIDLKLEGLIYGMRDTSKHEGRLIYVLFYNACSGIHLKRIIFDSLI